MYFEEYINELYKQYTENSKRTAEHQTASEKSEKKYDELQKIFTEKQLEKIDEFENCLSELFQIEVKNAFGAGFMGAKALILDSQKNNLDNK